jgi:hypothetical protein
MKIKPEEVEPELMPGPGMQQDRVGLVGGLGASHKATCEAHVTIPMLRQIDNCRLIGVSGESRHLGASSCPPMTNA